MFECVVHPKKFEWWAYEYVYGGSYICSMKLGKKYLVI